MNARTMAVLAGVSALLMLNGSATAGFVAVTFEQLPIDDFHGIVTLRVYAQFDGTQGQSGNDFASTVSNEPNVPLAMNVRGGTFFQHPANTHGGGDLSPDPSLCADDPTVCMDTFVTIGRETSIGDATILVPLFPGWPGFGRDSFSCGDLSCGWTLPGWPNDFPQGIPDENGRVLLMQLSTQDGVGFSGTGDFTGLSNGLPFTVVYSFDSGCYPDIDGDNIVGIIDFLLVLAEWGPCAPKCLADVDGDGEVGILDFLLVLANWGPCE